MGVGRRGQCIRRGPTTGLMHVRVEELYIRVNHENIRTRLGCFAYVAGLLGVCSASEDVPHAMLFKESGWA